VTNLPCGPAGRQWVLAVTPCASPRHGDETVVRARRSVDSAVARRAVYQLVCVRRRELATGVRPESRGRGRKAGRADLGGKRASRSSPHTSLPSAHAERRRCGYDLAPPRLGGDGLHRRERTLPRDGFLLFFLSRGAFVRSARDRVSSYDQILKKCPRDAVNVRGRDTGE
jgi:hypothetical protein